MRAIIIEDEQRSAKRMRNLIEASGRNINIIACLGSVYESNDWFENNALPDLIFSDIQLGDGTAFDVFGKMQKIPPVIFTTAYDEFALIAFKANGIDYLLKPIDPEELNHAIDKFLSFNQKEDELSMDKIAKLLQKEDKIYKSRFIIKVGEKIKSVKTEEIACFYSMMKFTYLQTKQKRNYPIDYTLDQLEDTLDPRSFFRVNRKVVIHFDAIDEIHTWSGSRLKIVLLCNYDEDVVVSRDRVKEFKAWLDR
ncbi:MAG: DNA-binding response regulator [Bacteroidetes bacterium]|nr:MAG: DNA-binding response regulator [Bacteroidota bacterium]